VESQATPLDDKRKYEPGSRMPWHGRPVAPGPADEPDRPGTQPGNRPAIRIGRIFGIEVGLDWSWLFIFLLITFSLTQGFVHEESWGHGRAWGAGLLTSVLFFVSILLHELGHSLTSQLLGLPVRSITLFIFGGLARLSGEPTRPRDDFLIAAAGPAVSVTLGLAFLLGGRLMPDSGAVADILRVSFDWLGVTNLMLAAFNLVPGFPLDGGRLLRALVWHFSGSFEKATYAASAIGTGFAYALIATGIFTALFLGALFAGMWLAFIGWFLLTAARGTAQRVTLERELGCVPIATAMDTLEPTVDVDATVAEVLESFVLGQGRRSLFVTEHGHVEGLITLHEIKRLPTGQRALTPVRDIMLRRQQLVTARKDESLWRAFTLMNEAEVGQVPVEENGEIIGVVSRERLVGILHNLRQFQDDSQARLPSRPGC